jgi:ASC-1-like (ASCH) protein
MLNIVYENMKALHLHLVLKHQYYDAIDKGEKTIEYRDNTPYWRKRINEKWDSNGGNKVTFHKGYTKITVTYQIKMLVLNRGRIELHLGEREK